MLGYIALSVDELGEVHPDRREGVPTLEDMQGVVGGYIDTAFRVPSPFRKNVSIDFYVNDEGLLIGLPQVVGVLSDSYKQVFAGSMVIVAGDERNGETVGMTDEEMTYILHQLWVNGFGIFFFDFREGSVSPATA